MRNIFCHEDPVKDVIEMFEMQHPSIRTYFIIGAPGSGKTALLCALKEHFDADPAWRMISLAPDADMLAAASAALPPLGVPCYAPGVRLKFQIRREAEDGKRLIFLVDDVCNNFYAQMFCSHFQVLVRESLPVFFVIAGTPENIDALKNHKTITFLWRVPRIYLNEDTRKEEN